LKWAPILVDGSLLSVGAGLVGSICARHATSSTSPQTQWREEGSKGRRREGKGKGEGKEEGKEEEEEEGER
jgi:hypothetical protein